MVEILSKNLLKIAFIDFNYSLSTLQADDMG